MVGRERRGKGKNVSGKSKGGTSHAQGRQLVSGTLWVPSPLLSNLTPLLIAPLSPSLLPFHVVCTLAKQRHSVIRMIAKACAAAELALWQAAWLRSGGRTGGRKGVEELRLPVPQTEFHERTPSPSIPPSLPPSLPPSSTPVHFSTRRPSAAFFPQVCTFLQVSRSHAPTHAMPESTTRRVFLQTGRPPSRPPSRPPCPSTARQKDMGPWPFALTSCRTRGGDRKVK